MIETFQKYDGAVKSLLKLKAAAVHRRCTQETSTAQRTFNSRRGWDIPQTDIEHGAAQTGTLLQCSNRSECKAPAPKADSKKTKKKGKGIREKGKGGSEV